ncbi:hypothetical protein AVEN_29961-1 [Araneus ventricosus]|uniref:Uncharacterized protein n=1 Tax=Araneus ventricosus TaxID=182803 RepID=A0A4Y2UFV9_ARAVE|nr:hypothetical protein AVEN_29961-1 [Araneus ventricosus]
MRYPPSPPPSSKTHSEPLNSHAFPCLHKETRTTKIQKHKLSSLHLVISGIGIPRVIGCPVIRGGPRISDMDATAENAAYPKIKYRIEEGHVPCVKPPGPVIFSIPSDENRGLIAAGMQLAIYNTLGRIRENRRRPIEGVTRNGRVTMNLLSISVLPELANSLRLQKHNSTKSND